MVHGGGVRFSTFLGAGLQGGGGCPCGGVRFRHSETRKASPSQIIRDPASRPSIPLVPWRRSSLLWLGLGIIWPQTRFRNVSPAFCASPATSCTKSSPRGGQRGRRQPHGGSHTAQICGPKRDSSAATSVFPCDKHRAEWRKLSRLLVTGSAKHASRAHQSRRSRVGRDGRRRGGNGTGGCRRVPLALPVQCAG